MNKTKQIALLLVLAFAAAMTFLGLGIKIGRSETGNEQTVTHDTIYQTDTVRLPAPPPDTVTKTVTKVVKVPLHDTVTLVDSVWVELPFEQHFSRLEDVADVWYSGYQAKIDSATIYRHQQTIIEKHYIERPAKDNIIGIEAGTKDAGILYLHRLGAFHVGFSAGTTYTGEPTARGIVGYQF